MPGNGLSSKSWHRDAAVLTVQKLSARMRKSYSSPSSVRSLRLARRTAVYHYYEEQIMSVKNLSIRFGKVLMGISLLAIMGLGGRQIAAAAEPACGN